MYSRNGVNERVRSARVESGRSERGIDGKIRGGLSLVVSFREEGVSCCNRPGKAPNHQIPRVMQQERVKP